MFDFTDDGLQSDSTHGSILQGRIYELEAHGHGCMLKNAASKRRQFCVEFCEQMKTNLKIRNMGFVQNTPNYVTYGNFPNKCTIVELRSFFQTCNIQIRCYAGF